MSVGLLLKSELKPGFLTRFAVRKSSDQLLSEIESWVREYCVDLRATTYIGKRDDRPTLFCRLHPAGEDMEISFTSSDHLTATANTSTVGPGYHIFVCDMLHKLGKRFHAQWDPPNDDYCDETGYFHSGDRQQVFAQMTAWLKGVANLFFDGTLKDDVHPTRLAMPLDVGFDWDARAITPLGPRDLDWLRKTAADGNYGQDFFAWWSPEMNSEYFLRRALARMWSDVRWRHPVNDHEKEVLAYVDDSLKTAFKLDPSLAFPLAEWAEILDYLESRDGDDKWVCERAQGMQAIIGYRRREVAVQLPGNWWITVPGSFSDFAADENHNYSALDPPREVWVTSYTFKGDLGKSLQSQRDEIGKRESVLVHQSDDYVAWAEIKEKSDGGQRWFSLTSSNVGLGHRAICTIVFLKPEDRDWAIRTWKSLHPPQRSVEKS